MADVAQSIMQPDEAAIKAHLELLFNPLQDEYPRGLIELRHGPDFRSAYFNLQKDGIADAAAFAAARSRAADNVYVGVNPRKPGTHAKGAATDADVECAIWHFADIDKAESLQGLAKKLRALPPYCSITTGTIPHRRPHLYWLLDEPVRNMAEWTQRQRGLQVACGGDAVINPSRIMRLAGTVNFPPQHKVQRGYRVELVTIKTDFEDEREAATPQEVASAYPPPQADYSAPSAATGTNTSQAGQTTLQAMQRTQVQDLIDACRDGNEWHNNMIRLVAHLAAIGRTSAEILAMADHITLPGYTADQTRREMGQALRSARTKWDLPEPDDHAVEAEEATREPADSTFQILNIDELDALPPPSWLIHEMIVDDGLSVIYGDPGAGKSFFALDMGLRLSHGMDWHGYAAVKAGVLYIAGEGARGLGKRIKGWRYKHAMDGIDAPFLLLPIAVELLDEKQRAKLLRTIDEAVQRAGFDIRLVVVDTVSRALAGADENGQEAMGAFVKACDAIRVHTKGAVLGVHHSGKDKDRGMRGSTVLLGACDAVFKVSKRENGNEIVALLATEKQKDAEQAEPIAMTLEKVSWATGLQEEQTTLVPIKREGGAYAAKATLDQEQIYKAFGIITDAWGANKPLSMAPQSKRAGRYAPRILSKAVGATEQLMTEYLISWLETECIEDAICDRKTKVRGLRSLAIPGRE